jgi:hypothetical protein
MAQGEAMLRAAYRSDFFVSSSMGVSGDTLFINE